MQYINSTYRRTGTRWDSRYQFSLIDANTYLLRCQRYIEINPVRAAMVTEPACYRWTRYRHNALGEGNRYLTPHPLYLALGKDAQARQTAYQDLFREPLDDKTISDIRLTLNQNQPLGNHRCFARIEAMTGQHSNPKPRGRPKKQPDEAAAQEAGQTESPL